MSDFIVKILAEVQELINDFGITGKVKRALLIDKYNFSQELAEELVPKEDDNSY